MTPAIEWIVTEPWGRLGIRTWPGEKVFVHCEVVEWSVRAARKCAGLWVAFKAEMVKRGISVVYSAVPSGGDLVNKWQRKFGMKLIIVRDGIALYSLEIRHGN